MVVDPVKQRKAKQRKGQENKRKQIMTKSPLIFHQKSIKIVLKSRSRGGLGNSWGLSLLQVALSWASWGVLGSICHQKRAKKNKNKTFFDPKHTVAHQVEYNLSNSDASGYFLAEGAPVVDLKNGNKSNSN